MERNGFEIVYSLSVLYLDDIKSNFIDNTWFSVPGKRVTANFQASYKSVRAPWRFKCDRSNIMSETCVAKCLA